MAAPFAEVWRRFAQILTYAYDGPKRPKRAFLEHLTITEKYEVRDFGILRKFAENYKITKPRKKYATQIDFRQFPDIFRNFRAIFGKFPQDPQNGEIRNFFRNL